MSFGRVVHESMSEAATQRRELSKRAERSTVAAATVLERCPDLHDGRTGCACPWAVWALLELQREHGEKNVTPRMLRQRRAEKLARFEDRRGYPAYPTTSAPTTQGVQHADR